ncbi:MAG: hypothetical protein ACLU5E_10460 [Anaerovoracaceae bacterium]
MGDSTEGVSYICQNLGIDHETLEDKYSRVFEQPFDSDRKRIITVHVIDEKITAYAARR